MTSFMSLSLFPLCLIYMDYDKIYVIDDVYNIKYIKYKRNLLTFEI